MSKTGYICVPSETSAGSETEGDNGGYHNDYSTSEKLSSQAGKLNEEYCSKLKESEERNMKRSRKLIGIVIAIQSAQLIFQKILKITIV